MDGNNIKRTKAMILVNQLWYRVFGPDGSYAGDCVIKEASPILTNQMCDQFKVEILNALNLN